MSTIVLFVDTELFHLAGPITIPASVVQEQRADLGILLFKVEMPSADRAALRDLRDTLEAMGVLAEHRWFSAVEAEHLLRRYEPVVWRYLLAKDGEQTADYLGFGAAFAGTTLGSYRVVRVPATHLDWLQMRLASGMQLGCTDVYDSYAEAAAAAQALCA